MAVTLIGEKFNRPGTKTKEKVSTTREFQVSTTDNESSLLVLECVGLPSINDPHDDNPKIICMQMQASPEVDGDTWLVTCNYEPSSVTISTQPGEEKPWDLPPYNISANSVAYNKVLKKSFDEGTGNYIPTIPVLNSAGDPFDPPEQYTEYAFALTFSYNKRHFNLRDVQNYQGTLNRAKITILGQEFFAQEGLITNLAATKIRVTDSDGDYQYSYYQIDCTVESDDHDANILDAGFYYKVAGVRKQIKLSSAGVLGDTGVEVTEPAKLDGSGGLLAEDGTPEYLPFQKHVDVSWSPLGLPEKMEG